MHDHGPRLSDDAFSPAAGNCPSTSADLPCGCQDVRYACGYIDREHDHVECPGTPAQAHTIEGEYEPGELKRITAPLSLAKSSIADRYKGQDIYPATQDETLRSGMGLRWYTRTDTTDLRVPPILRASTKQGMRELITHYL